MGKAPRQLGSAASNGFQLQKRFPRDFSPTFFFSLKEQKRRKEGREGREYRRIMRLPTLTRFTIIHAETLHECPPRQLPESVSEILRYCISC